MEKAIVVIISALVLVLISLGCVLFLVNQQNALNNEMIKKINESAGVQKQLKDDIGKISTKLGDQKKSSIAVAGVGIGLTVLSIAFESFHWGKTAKVAGQFSRHAGSLVNSVPQQAYEIFRKGM